MPLEHIVTAMSCLLSTCGNSNSTALMMNSVVSKPLDVVWGVGCKRQAVDLTNKLNTLLSNQEKVNDILNKLESSVKQLESIMAPNGLEERRAKRELADAFNMLTFPRFDCNSSTESTQNMEINNDMRSYLVGCGNNYYGEGWVPIASLNAPHGKRLNEKSPNELINGFGDFVIGNSVSEYFIGLEKLHVMTTRNGVCELLILMHDEQEMDRIETKATRHFMHYKTFVVADAVNDYRILKLDGYKGDIVDPLQMLLGQPFSLCPEEPRSC
ncbi:uncharacterized protein LOC128856551 isoform X2 [Anastrepha ludens]|uniref:uncharacterized protein LOC128856551 isoform X2 n=1 Tax=Anastrepha ludens TaxID=28586 RepID=UPI0023B13D8D|nr:uncharacterized protein LOC128856551 isoform X2 [Anastrepha ludens]